MALHEQRTCLCQGALCHLPQLRVSQVWMLCACLSSTAPHRDLHSSRSTAAARANLNGGWGGPTPKVSHPLVK